MSDDPVIAALTRCRLPDGVTSIDAQAVAGIVRACLARFETPEQQTRTLEQLSDGTATFAFIDVPGDYMLVVINSDTYDSREVRVRLHVHAVELKRLEHGRTQNARHRTRGGRQPRRARNGASASRARWVNGTVIVRF